MPIVRFRTQIVILSALLGFVVAMCFALTMYIVMETAESKLLHKGIVEETKALLETYTTQLDDIQSLLNIAEIHDYAQDDADIPDYFASINTDLEEITIDDISYEVVKLLRDGRVYYFMYDYNDFDHYEDMVAYSLVIGVIFATFLASWLGLFISNRVVAPLNLLKETYKNVEDEPLVDIARHFQRDEVGELAALLDQYNTKLAALINREKRFSADVSHELRTPISVIKGAAELLLDDESLDEHNRARALRIMSATNTMQELVETFLLIARNPEKLHANYARFDVKPIIVEEVALVKEVLGQREVDIRINGYKPLTAYGLPTAMTIIIRNLLRNAFCHTSNSTIEVSLSSDCITIKDSGPCMSQHPESSVYARAMDQRQAPGNSSGIGLHLVKRLCEMCCWNIDILSETTKGTEIRIYNLT